ncbi:hypothetical protein ASPTUDRAFT_180373 [Aspergillus tubingensis CBS 134.48]|uniref:Uncharacterized protein n=1 Tax=Aspergillus tubingensis (strain CBS 134.48) TaxID=767770 RepID=A0A1L9MRZ2_ASPTC|nr:hypothetical protein ASPTUDRAFT_180373 [Aspergillus tubingensis CBS 134.48]
MQHPTSTHPSQLSKSRSRLGYQPSTSLRLTTRIPLAGPLPAVDVSCPAMSTEDRRGHLHGRWEGHDNRKWKLMNYAYDVQIIEAQGPSHRGIAATPGLCRSNRCHTSRIPRMVSPHSTAGGTWSVEDSAMTEKAWNRKERTPWSIECNSMIL